MAKNSQAKKKKTVQKKELTAEETFNQWLKKKNPIEQRYALYTVREAELEQLKRKISNELLMLQLKRKALSEVIEAEDERAQTIRKIGEKKLAYDVHFVDAYKVKEKIREFKEDRVETRETFSEIQEKIESLRKLQDEIQKRETAIKSIKKAF